MIVCVDGGGVALAEIATLTAFKVVVPEAERARLREALAPAGRFDGQHAWISAAWLRRAAGDQPPGWTLEFEKMLVFAKTKGWFDEASQSIRAHVEWVS